MKPPLQLNCKTKRSDRRCYINCISIFPDRSFCFTLAQTYRTQIPISIETLNSQSQPVPGDPKLYLSRVRKEGKDGYLIDHRDKFTFTLPDDCTSYVLVSSQEHDHFLNSPNVN
jgi:hypothetical protein